MIDYKKVSIIIPTYNRAGTITNCLNSILNQTYNLWECIVVDDFSEDDTKNIVQEFIKKDSRFKYYQNQRKKGAPGARNTGLINSIGQAIVFFDSDDYMLPTFIEKLLFKLQNDNADVCTCYTTIINSVSNQKIGSFEYKNYNNINKKLLSGKTYVDNNAAIIKKNILQKISLLDEECPSYQEWDTHLRLSRIANYTTVPEELVFYYQGASDTLSSNKIKKIDGLIYILKKHQSLWQENKWARIKLGLKIHRLLVAENVNSTFFIKSINTLYVLIPHIKFCIFISKIYYKLLWLKGFVFQKKN